MPTSRERRGFERGRHELVRLAHAGLGRREFLHAAADALAAAVQFDGACWHTHDPATLLITSHETNLDGSGFAFICRNEYAQEDFNKFAELARRRRPAAVLDGRASVRFRELYEPRGWGSELRATFGEAGATWGSAMLLRERGRPEFSASEASFLASVGRHMAHGLRTSLLAPAAAGASGEDGPGLVLLDSRGEPDEVTPAAARWLAELEQDARLPGTDMPAALVAVAARARAVAARPEAAAAPARAHVRGRSGRWLVLHGSSLGDRAAVIVEPASPLQLAPLVAAAYGLTRRERDVAALLLQGLTTAEIAQRLWLSRHTVQDYVKAIYEKTDARDRADLVARVFYRHAQPRLAAGTEPGPSGWFPG